MADSQSVTIPDKPAFKASEVCELAQIQPYVLRSWESEFPDLGLSKTPGGPRIYRRIDVERVLRIRDLVFVEGLTLSGVRRRFEAEQPQPPDDLFAFVAEVQAAQARAARATSSQPPAAARAPEAELAPTPVAASSAAASTPSLATDIPTAAVPDAARDTLVQVKHEMRSLLELLGGDAPAPAPLSPRRGRTGVTASGRPPRVG